jgi:hypothetical protein
VRILPRVLILCGHRPALVADFSPGFVPHLRDYGPIGIGDETRRAEMIANNEIQNSVFLHRNALTACIVILGYFTARHFIVRADEVGGCCANIRRQNGFYPLSVAIVGESCIRKNAFRVQRLVDRFGVVGDWENRSKLRRGGRRQRHLLRLNRQRTDVIAIARFEGIKVDRPRHVGGGSHHAKRDAGDALCVGIQVVHLAYQRVVHVQAQVAIVRTGGGGGFPFDLDGLLLVLDDDGTALEPGAVVIQYIRHYRK